MSSFHITCDPPSLEKDMAYPLSRVLITTGDYKNTPFPGLFSGNLPETLPPKYPLSQANGNTHAAPLCIILECVCVGGGGGEISSDVTPRSKCQIARI